MSDVPTMAPTPSGIPFLMPFPGTPDEVAGGEPAARACAAHDLAGPLAAQALATLPAHVPAQGLLRTLPAPSPVAGQPLMRALSLRHSTREYLPTPLSMRQLADVLWSAGGVNRPGDGRTAPYWRHPTGVSVYAVMTDGVWLYEPGLHALRQHLGIDLRAQTGIQDFVGTAPLNLVYVVHGERMEELPADERRLRGSVDAAFAGQNVYLYCASEGLGCVFRDAPDADLLAHAMRLSAGQFVVFAQTVGYPAA